MEREGAVEVVDNPGNHHVVVYTAQPAYHHHAVPDAFEKGRHLEGTKGTPACELTQGQLHVVQGHPGKKETEEVGNQECTEQVKRKVNLFGPCKAMHPYWHSM